MSKIREIDSTIQLLKQQRLVLANIELREKLETFIGKHYKYEYDAVNPQESYVSYIYVSNIHREADPYDEMSLVGFTFTIYADGGIDFSDPAKPSLLELIPNPIDRISKKKFLEVLDDVLVDISKIKEVV